MVSEMRARVRVLEQKIHTRVPRLRMGSITGRANPAASPVSALGSSSSSSGSLATTAKTSLDSIRRSADSRQSNEPEPKGNHRGDTSGWVLVMEDSPSPVKVREVERQRERRRVSSPNSPSAYLSGSSHVGITSPTFGKDSSTLNQSTKKTGIRRPASRLSGTSQSTTTTSSSIPTPTSRPATPTLLPLSTSGLLTSTPGSKRSIPSGGAVFDSGGQKRTPLNASPTRHSSDYVRIDRSTILPRRSGFSMSTPRSSVYDEMKPFPQSPSKLNFHPPKVPLSGSVLTKSRIGRPRGAGLRRSGSNSGMESELSSGDALDIKDPRSPRPGS